MSKHISTMPWGPLKGRPITPDHDEKGHHYVMTSFGWHHCSRQEDSEIQKANKALSKDQQSHEETS